MSVTRLAEKRVEKVWGRRDLPEMFGGIYEGEEPLGEIWFELPGADAELLIKYLFTSERLSIQVHPDEEAAHRAGLAHGKEEAWIILRAEPDATIGLGLRQRVTRDHLRAAALDGSIEQLVDWRPVKAGDTLYSPAGTVHALGPGLTLIEVQQNVDVTYRLYDYGRPRELHLDEGLAVTRLEPHTASMKAYLRSPGREILAEGPAFVVERWLGPAEGMLSASNAAPIWLIPLTGSGALGGQPLEPGSVWHLDERTELSLPPGGELLVAYPGSDLRDPPIALSRPLHR